MDVTNRCWCSCRICKSIFRVGATIGYVFRCLVLGLVSDMDLTIRCWCLCRVCKSKVGVGVSFGMDCDFLCLRLCHILISIFGVGASVGYVFRHLVWALLSSMDVTIRCWC